MTALLSFYVACKSASVGSRGPGYQLENQAQAELYANILRNSLNAGLLGAAGGSGWQLFKWLNKPDIAGEARESNADQDVSLPYPVQPAQKRRRPPSFPAGIVDSGGPVPSLAQDKFAADETKGDWASYLGGKISPYLPAGWGRDLSLAPAAPVGVFGSWYEKAKTNPGTAAASALLPVAALGAGWYGASRLGNALQTREQNAQLEAARKDYEDALLGQYAQPKRKRKPVAGALTPGMKHAEAEEPEESRPLRELFESGALPVEKNPPQQEKRAIFESMGNLYGGYALTTAPLMAYLGFRQHYNSKGESIRAALKRRAAMRLLEDPPKFHLLPAPKEMTQARPVGGAELPTDEEEENTPRRGGRRSQPTTY